MMNCFSLAGSQIGARAQVNFTVLFLCLAEVIIHRVTGDILVY